MSESARHKLSALSENLDSVQDAHFKIDDMSLRSSIPRQMVDSGPDWWPSKPLPLSFSAAEQIGREELGKIIENESIWELTEITLQRIQCPGREQTKWFYSLAFRPPGGWCSHPDSFTIPIALSGTPGITGL